MKMVAERQPGWPRRNRQAQRLRVGRERLLRAPALTYRAGRYSKPLERLSNAFMLRVYRQCLLEVGNGLLAPSLGLEEMAPVSVGYDGAARINRDGLAVVGDSAVVISFVLVRAAPVVVGLGEARVEPDRLIEVGDATVVVLLARIRDAPIGVGDGAVACRYVRLEHGRAAADLHVKGERLALVPAPGLVRCQLLGRDRQANHKDQRHPAEAQSDVFQHRVDLPELNYCLQPASHRPCMPKRSQIVKRRQPTVSGTSSPTKTPAAGGPAAGAVGNYRA